MALVYLSPSTREYNKFYDNSNSEGYYMRIIADYMEPYLAAANISFTRNKPKMTAGQSADHSNETKHDLYLAIRTNTGEMGKEGTLRGVNIYYLEGSPEGKRAAEIFMRNFKSLYPNPQMVNIIPNTSFVELNRPKAPAVMVGVGYHDNPSDAEWIKNNLQFIACNLSLSVTEFFDIEGSQPRQCLPEIHNDKENTAVPPSPKANEEQKPQKIAENKEKEGVKATVSTGGRRLNLRAKPDFNSRILGQIPDKTLLEVCSAGDGWYKVRYNGILGYVAGEFLSING